jgi:hypothetical protein
MAEGTDFWSSHSALKNLRDKAIQYINQHEHRVKILEKIPRTGCGNQVIEVKGLFRHYDPLKTLTSQDMEVLVIDLDFDPALIKTYKELGLLFKKNPNFDSRYMATRMIDLAALELKYMLGCDQQWIPVPKENKGPSAGPALPAAASAPAAREAPASPARNDQARAGTAGPLSDGEEENGSEEGYPDGADRGGDRHVAFTMLDPDNPYDVDWSEFVYPVAKHFVPRFRECHAVALMFFFDDELAAKFPDLSGQIHAGWQAHYNRPMNLNDILEPPKTGENAYDDEELTWLFQTARYYLAKLTPEQREEKGINPRTAKKVTQTHQVRRLSPHNDRFQSIIPRLRTS